LSDIAENIEYIPFQTTENSLIGRIVKIKIHESILYVNTGTKLCCFDMSGHYLNKLDNRGRGPGEYSFISDFDVDPEGNLLSLDSNNNILIFKNSKNKFIYSRTIKLYSSGLMQDIAFIDIVPQSNNIFLSYNCGGNESLRNLLIDNNGDTLNVRPNYNRINSSNILSIAGLSQNIIYEYNNSLYFKEWYSDTVFSIDQSNMIIPSLILDAKGRQFTSDVIARILKTLEKDPTALMRMYETPTAPYLVVTNIMEVPRFIFYTYSYKHVTNYEVYDKKLNRKFGINNKTFLNDDLLGGVTIEPKFCNNDKLFSWIDALTLINNRNYPDQYNIKNKDKVTIDSFVNMIDSIEETDNPVLVMITPKK